MPALPPPVPDERTALLAFLRQARYWLTLTTYGLRDDQAGSAASVSPLTVAGLIKHVTAVERQWMDVVAQAPPRITVETYGASFTLGDEETLESVLADYAVAAGETEAVIAGIDDLGTAVPVPRDAPWFPADVEAWSVRWVLLHLIYETSRHCGHADIVRESVDGATSFPLIAAAEGWPATPWMQPWAPALTA